MFYRIPETLPAELDELDGYIAQFAQGKLDAAALKARRVPFGCYEQRKDGSFMVRIRTTGGALTPAQLKAIAQTASRYGAADFLHVTTRQEFQIHDLALADVTAVMRDLLAAGLSTRGGGGNTVRNIMVSPEAGIGADEVFDPSPYAFALTTRLIAEGDSWLLPRKLKITFSNSPADTAYAQFNDIGFIARIENGVKGFRVYVAGGMGNKPQRAHLLHDFVPAGEVYLVAEAIKRLFDKHGNRKNRHGARLRFLWTSLGEARFRELYQAERGQIEEAGTHTLTVDELPEAPTPPAAASRPADADFARWKARFAQPQRQKGLFSVLLPIFLGNIKTADAIRLADALAPLGPHVLRATFGQNLRLRNIPEAVLGDLWAVIKDIGNPLPRPLADAIACTGADTCKLGICLPRGALSATARRLAKSKLALDEIGDFRLNLSGCPNSCGQHLLADLGFFGNAARKDQRMYPAYAVVAGARQSDGEARMGRPVGRVSARALPQFVEDVLGLWLDRKGSYRSFADYVDGVGHKELVDLTVRYEEVPDFEDDKNFYYDWGADEPFSLVGRGIGECSAGLFDLIEVDLRNARAQIEVIAAGSTAERDEALYRAVLHAARALLITRGIEAPTDEAVLGGFRRHFIDAGLIDARFDPLLAAALAKDSAELRRDPGQPAELLAAVEALYQTMDNSLRFPAEAKPAAPAPAAADVERDYRTVACPMNFVKVKLDLETMQAGQKLKVVLGDGEPIRNVPRSVEEEGHKVLSQTREGEAWSVLIEKH